jgi:hypothetical protein
MNMQPDMEKAASRKESLMREKTTPQNSAKIKEIKNPLKDNKFSKTQILALSVGALGIVGISAWGIYSSFLAQPEIPLTISGPQTLAEEYLENGYIPPPQGEGGRNPSVVGDGPFGLPADPGDPTGASNPEFTIEDYINQVTYVVESGSNIASGSPSAPQTSVYKITGPTSQTEEDILTAIGNAIRVPGKLESTNIETWWGSMGANDDVDTTKPHVLTSLSDVPSRSLNAPIISWSYDEGDISCTLNLPYDITGYTQSQLNAIPKSDRDCYYSKSALGITKPFPANPSQARASAEQIMSTIGFNLQDFEITTIEGDLTTIIFNYKLDGEASTMEFTFNYSDGNKLRTASGNAFSVTKIGEYSMVTPREAVSRLNNILYYTAVPYIYKDRYKAPFYYRPYGPDGGPLGVSYATHVQVQYAEGINPTSNTTPPGFNTSFKIVSNPRWVSPIDEAGNIWLIALGEDMDEVEAYILTEQLARDPQILRATIDLSTVRSEEYRKDQQVNVNITDFYEVWGEIVDSEGAFILTRTYMFTNEDENYIVGTVTALSENALRIR